MLPSLSRQAWLLTVTFGGRTDQKQLVQLLAAHLAPYLGDGCKFQAVAWQPGGYIRGYTAPGTAQCPFKSARANQPRAHGRNRLLVMLGQHVLTIRCFNGECSSCSSGYIYIMLPLCSRNKLCLRERTQVVLQPDPGPDPDEANTVLVPSDATSEHVSEHEPSEGKLKNNSPSNTEDKDAQEELVEAYLKIRAYSYPVDEGKRSGGRTDEAKGGEDLAEQGTLVTPHWRDWVQPLCRRVTAVITALNCRLAQPVSAVVESTLQLSDPDILENPPIKRFKGVLSAKSQCIYSYRAQQIVRHAGEAYIEVEIDDAGEEIVMQASYSVCDAARRARDEPPERVVVKLQPRKQKRGSKKKPEAPGVERLREGDERLLCQVVTNLRTRRLYEVLPNAQSRGSLAVVKGISATRANPLWATKGLCDCNCDSQCKVEIKKGDFWWSCNTCGARRCLEQRVNRGGSMRDAYGSIDVWNALHEPGSRHVANECITREDVNTEWAAPFGITKVHNLLLFLEPRGAGKTYQLQKALSALLRGTQPEGWTDPMIEALRGYRLTYCQALANRFQEFGFVLKPSPESKSNYCIWTFESIWNVTDSRRRVHPEGEVHYQILLLDEVESLLHQAAQGLNAPKESANLETFEMLVASADVIFALDAFLSVRTVEVLLAIKYELEKNLSLYRAKDFLRYYMWRMGCDEQRATRMTDAQLRTELSLCSARWALADMPGGRGEGEEREREEGIEDVPVTGTGPLTVATEAKLNDITRQEYLSLLLRHPGVRESLNYQTARRIKSQSSLLELLAAWCRFSGRDPNLQEEWAVRGWAKQEHARPRTRERACAHGDRVIFLETLAKLLLDEAQLPAGVQGPQQRPIDRLLGGEPVYLGRIENNQSLLDILFRNGHGHFLQQGFKLRPTHLNRLARKPPRQRGAAAADSAPSALHCSFGLAKGPTGKRLRKVGKHHCYWRVGLLEAGPKLQGKPAREGEKQKPAKNVGEPLRLDAFVLINEMADIDFRGALPAATDVTKTAERDTRAAAQGHSPARRSLDSNVQRTKVSLSKRKRASEEEGLDQAALEPGAKAVRVSSAEKERLSEEACSLFVPFGKYKNKCLQEMLDDAAYVQWVRGQGLMQDFNRVFDSGLGAHRGSVHGSSGAYRAYESEIHRAAKQRICDWLREANTDGWVRWGPITVFNDVVVVAEDRPAAGIEVVYTNPVTKEKAKRLGSLRAVYNPGFCLYEVDARWVLSQPTRPDSPCLRLLDLGVQ
eukprot:g13165.t1